MIDALKDDDVVTKVGGRFRLTALIQKRWLELLQGARPQVDATGKTQIEIVIDEILQDKISIDYEGSDIEPPSDP